MFTLIFAFAVPAFSASGINKAETQILKMLQKGTKYNEDFYQYHNAIKVYFNRDSISMSQLQADYACSELLDLYDSYTREDAVDDSVVYEKVRSAFMYMNIRYIFNRADSTVDLIGRDNSLVMASLQLTVKDGKNSIQLSPIKQTGSTVPVFAIVSAGALCLIGAAVISLWLVRKKRKELSK